MRQFLILLATFYCCSGLGEYEIAKTNVAIQKEANQKLYNQYNVPESDYTYVFACEKFNLSNSNRKADILLEYQRLVRKSGQCGKTDFTTCLRNAAKEIPEADRCELARGKCNRNIKYSQVSGLCNHVRSPNVGMAKMPYNRILESAYADNITEFRRTFNGKEMPNARTLSNILDNAARFKTATQEGESVNNFAGLMFGQLITHDTSGRNVVAMKGKGNNGINCCQASNSGSLKRSQRHPACVPVTLPKDDPFYASKGIFCQSFVRMQPTLEQDCSVRVNHENLVTSYLDLNIIYSNSNKTLKELRTKEKGLFKGMEPLNILPTDKTGNFLSGDFRSGQTPGLTIMHSLFYRLHNIIAKQLAKLNPKWDDDTIFFETRSICTAIYQRIIYYEYLPLILGYQTCNRYNLNCKGICAGYDPKIDPTTTIEFAMNAFRFFHINVPSTMQMVNKAGKVVKEVPLSDTYGKVDMLKADYNNILRGLLKQEQRNNLASYSGEIKNLFLKTEYRGQVVGMDLSILDLMRSRDSGSPPFVAFFPKCLNKEKKTWKSLSSHFEDAHFKLLQQLYKNVTDIELFTGILLEKRNGNSLGKIGRCLVAEQFYRYRYGDRFFYAHENHPRPFSADQLNEIGKMTFARLLCMTTDIGRVPRKGFVAVSKKNPFINCSELSSFRLSRFKQ